MAPVFRPRHMTKSERKVVRTFRKTVRKLTRRVHTLRVILHSAPKNRRPVIRRKITHIVHRITHIHKTIRRIVRSNPRFSKPLPKDETPEEAHTVNVFKRKVNRIIHRVNVVRRKITHLRVVVKTAPAKRRPVIRKRIVHLTHVVKRLTKTIVHIKRTIRRITRPVPKPLTKAQIRRFIRQSKNAPKRIHRLTVREHKMTKRIKVERRRVRRIRRTLPTIRHHVHHIEHTVHTLQHTIRRLMRPRLTCHHNGADELTGLSTELSTCHDDQRLSTIRDRIALIQRLRLSCVHPAPVQKKITHYTTIIRRTIKKIRPLVKRVTIIRRKIVNIRKVIKRTTTIKTRRIVLRKQVVVLRRTVRKIIRRIRPLRKIVRVNLTHITRINRTVTRRIKPVFSCRHTAEETAAIKKCSVQITTCEARCATIHGNFMRFKKQAHALEATCKADPSDSVSQAKLDSMNGKLNLVTSQESDCNMKCQTVTHRCQRYNAPSKMCLRPKPIRQKVIRFRKVVRKLTVTVHKLVTRRVIIRRTIRRLVRRIRRQPARRPVLIKKITHFRTVIRTINKKIVNIRRTIRKVHHKIIVIRRAPVSVFTKKERTTIVHIKTVIRRNRPILRKLHRRIRVIRRKIVHLTHVLTTIKKTNITRRTTVTKNIRVFRKTVRKLRRRVVVVRKVIHHATHRLHIIQSKRNKVLRPIFTCAHSKEQRMQIATLRKERRQCQKTCNKPHAGSDCWDACTVITRNLRRFTTPGMTCVHKKPTRQRVIRFRRTIIKRVRRIIKLTHNITKIRRTIVVVRRKIKSAPVSKRPTFRKRITVLRRRITIIRRKIRVVRHQITHVVRQMRPFRRMPKHIHIGRPRPTVVKHIRVAVHRLVHREHVLKRRVHKITRRVRKLVHRLHRHQKVVRRIHRRLVRTQKIVRVSKIAAHARGPRSTGMTHYTHKMFRCTVWRQPIVRGPFPGPGLSKSENLSELIKSERVYLAKLQGQAKALANLINRQDRQLNRLNNQN